MRNILVEEYVKIPEGGTYYKAIQESNITKAIIF